MRSLPIIRQTCSLVCGRFLPRFFALLIPRLPFACLWHRRYCGYEPTTNIRALVELVRALRHMAARSRIFPCILRLAISGCNRARSLCASAPAHSLIRIVTTRHSSGLAVDAGEFTFPKYNQVGATLREETTMRTFLAGSPQ